MTYSALITGTLIPLEQPGVKSLAEGYTDGDDCIDRTSNLLHTSSLHHKSNEATVYQKLACNCKHVKCAKKVTPAERETCFTQFYQLSQNRKYDFVAMTTDCKEKERQTCDEPQRKRTFSFKYYLKIESEKSESVSSFIWALLPENSV